MIHIQHRQPPQESHAHRRRAQRNEQHAPQGTLAHTQGLLQRMGTRQTRALKNPPQHQPQTASQP